MAEQATQGSYPRVAIVFDLDDTLAPDTYRSLVESCGLDYATFERERIEPLDADGWDDILAKFYAYLLALSKGIDTQTRDGRPADVYRPVPPDQLHVPLDQIVYVGDGASDMPVFALLNERHGIAIGVFKSDTPRDWPGYKDMRAARRVENLAPADFREGSELLRSLTLAVERVCKQIALRELGRGE